LEELTWLGLTSFFPLFILFLLLFELRFRR